MKHPTRTGIVLILLAVALIVAAALVGECSVVNGNTRVDDLVEKARLTYWAVVQAMIAVGSLALSVPTAAAGIGILENRASRAGGGA